MDPAGHPQTGVAVTPGIRTYTTYAVECSDCDHTVEAARSDGWIAAKLARNLRGHGWMIGRDSAYCPPCASVRRYGSARRNTSQRQ